MIKKEVLENVFNIITKENILDIITGFKDLDSLLKDSPFGSIITIGARPAMGKTSFIVSILLNLLNQNKKCLVFSSCESEIMLIKRLIIQIENIDYFLLKNKELLNEKYNEKIKKALNKISNYNLTIDDKYLDLMHIKEQIELIQPKYVFIDSLEGINNNINENILSEFKQISEKNNCIFFIVSGLTSAVENRKNKRPVLSDMRNSKILVNISDIVMLIYRDEYYVYKKEYNDKSNNGIADIIVAKNKYGQIGTVKLKFNHLTTKFSDYL